MLATLRQLLAPLIDPPAAGPDAHTLELATAVLLVEVMRAEGGLGAAEQAAALHALQRKFALSDTEQQALLAQAQQVAEAATDLHQFTSLLNQRLDDAAKVRMVEALWGVAYADGTLAAHERHIVWRIADLLHLRPGDYAAAKTRARLAAGVA